MVEREHGLEGLVRDGVVGRGQFKLGMAQLAIRAKGTEPTDVQGAGSVAHMPIPTRRAMLTETPGIPQAMPGML